MRLRTKLRDFTRRRKGAAALILAIMVPVMVGVVGLAIDTAVLGVANVQLQTAADAAALAGAAQLEHSTVTQDNITAAGSAAVSFAGKNSVLGTPLKIASVPGSSGSENITVGYIAPNDPSKTLKTDSSLLASFNAVQVSAARTAKQGGAIPRFFAPGGTDMHADATAVVLAMTGFQKADGSTYVNCLPITLDQATAMSMFSGATTDLYSYNSATNGVTGGSDGITESRAYPVANGSPGNWGTVNIGVSNNGTSTLSSQITNGISPSQMATFTDGVLKPDSSTGVIVLGGNPGISAGIKSALTGIIGQTRWMPIYDPNRSGGNGNNAYYTIVSFAPIRVMAVNFSGSNKYVVVQPATISSSDQTLYWDVRPANTYPTGYRIALIK